MARLLLLKEDYSDTILYLTNLENNQLEIILKQMIFNDENGVCEEPEDIAKRFYPDNVLTCLGDTQSSDTDIIMDLNYKYIVNNSYYGFCEVVNNEIS